MDKSEQVLGAMDMMYRFVMSALHAMVIFCLFLILSIYWDSIFWLNPVIGLIDIVGSVIITLLVASTSLLAAQPIKKMFPTTAGLSVSRIFSTKREQTAAGEK